MSVIDISAMTIDELGVLLANVASRIGELNAADMAERAAQHCLNAGDQTQALSLKRFSEVLRGIK